MKRIAFLLLGLTPSVLSSQTTTTGPRVIPVYLVPRDLQWSRERLSLSVRALDSVRAWYGRVLRGRTFAHDPLVVQISRHTFAEFAADSFQAWWPLLQAEFQSYGLDWEDDATKLLWIAHGAGAWAGADSENGGIDSIAEAGRVIHGDRGGLSVIGDSTLGGYLAGVCPDSGRAGTAWWCSWSTFMGTVAHELGHTWGLPHPDAFSPGFRCADSTAWTNMQCHWGFPADTLLSYEQTHLRSLGYFRYSSAGQPFQLLSHLPSLRGNFRRSNFERGDSLLWAGGRGGGTGYLWGLLVLREVDVPGGDGYLVTDVALPASSELSVTVSILVDRVERYRRQLEPGDPPLPVAVPVRAGQRVRIRVTGPTILGNARLVER